MPEKIVDFEPWTVERLAGLRMKARFLRAWRVRFAESKTKAVEGTLLDCFATITYFRDDGREREFSVWYEPGPGNPHGWVNTDGEDFLNYVNQNRLAFTRFRLLR